MTITFETKCWEGDWKPMLKGGNLEKMIDACQYPFNKKTLFINNVKDMELVKYYAQKKVDAGIIDNFVIVEDYAEEAIKFFEIEKEDFKGGYYYSIAELVSIYICETDILLHFSSDTYLVKSPNNPIWIKRAAQLLMDGKYFTANPTWNKDWQSVADESDGEIETDYIGFGFSDQCYMGRVDKFRQPIYNETHEASDRYPKYGGELFEKRVDSYMRNNNQLRLTAKDVSYMHINFEDRALRKRVQGTVGEALKNNKVIYKIHKTIKDKLKGK